MAATEAERLIDRLFVAYARLPAHRGQERLLSVLRALLPRGRVRLRARCGRMSLDLRDGVQRQIVVGGAYEPRTVEAVAGALGPGGTFVDVGAHVGQFALVAAARVGPSGRVIALEPHPESFAALEENLALNAARNVIALRCAADVARGTVRLAFPPAGNRGAARLAAPDEPGIDVEAAPLAQILAGHGIERVDAMKVDVEGAELRVLASLFDASAIRPAHLFVEYLPEHFDYGAGAGGIPAYLAGHGYECRTVEGAPYAPGAALPENNLWARLRGARAS
jgi:FkbM family methyltransferase